MENKQSDENCSCYYCKKSIDIKDIDNGNTVTTECYVHSYVNDQPIRGYKMYHDKCKVKQDEEIEKLKYIEYCRDCSKKINIKTDKYLLIFQSEYGKEIICPKCSKLLAERINKNLSKFDDNLRIVVK